MQWHVFDFFVSTWKAKNLTVKCLFFFFSVSRILFFFSLVLVVLPFSGSENVSFVAFILHLLIFIFFFFFVSEFIGCIDTKPSNSTGRPVYGEVQCCQL